MLFKQNWEKGSTQDKLLLELIPNIVRLACGDNTVSGYQVIAGGCANCNVEVRVEDIGRPFIVRIYLRDQVGADRERALGVLLKPRIPVPLTYRIGDDAGYRFALTEFLPGITLRKLLLSDMIHDVGAIMYEVGLLLAKISGYQFSRAGFFDKNLNVLESNPLESYLKFVRKCFQNKTVIKELGYEMITKIHLCFERYADFFPDEDTHHLVHGDFDPANILVDKVDGEWKITGILDWEFAFSGSVLWDVANMSRYAHQMPLIFEEAFLLGLKSGGVSLADDWRRNVYLLNISSLLDCLARARSKSHPKQCADICKLINFFLGELDQ